MSAMHAHSPKFVPEQCQGHYPSICSGHSPRRVGLSMQSQSSGLCRGSEVRGGHTEWAGGFQNAARGLVCVVEPRGFSRCAGFTLPIIITGLG